MKVILVILSALVASILSEPPVNQYIPPSNQYGAPSAGGVVAFGGQTAIRPSSQYGAPSTGGYQGGEGDYSGVGGYQTGAGGYQTGTGGYGGGRGGYEDQYVSEPANYNFEYHVQDAASGNDFGHQESRQGDIAQGKYYVLLPDGRRQTVEYIADNEGYKPKISYEQVRSAFGAGAGGYQGGAEGYQAGGYQGGAGGYQGGAGVGGYQGGNDGYAGGYSGRGAAGTGGYSSGGSSGGYQY